MHYLLPLTTLVAAVAAIPQTQPVQARDDSLYDAVVVGGGPAGLSALSGLARVRRNVLLIDSGEYRNDPTRHVHDVIGFDGVTPAYYRWAAREQLSNYDTITMTNGTVTKIDPTDNNGNQRFTVSSTSEGGEETTVEARRIVLATGLKDILPETPGIEEAWGQGIFWCPWCDGHEHADQAMGLLASLENVAGMVRELSTLNEDFYAFVNGTDTPETRQAAEEEFPDWETYLAMHNVTVDNRIITQVTRLKDGGEEQYDPSLPTHPEHDLFRVDFETGEPVERAAFMASWPDAQKSSVGADMGVKLDDGRLHVDLAEGLITNVPGVYAIGDCNSEDVTNVPHALYSGKKSAVYLHVALATEDSDEALNHTQTLNVVNKRHGGLNLRSVWEEMNGEKGDILFAEGEFEQ